MRTLCGGTKKVPDPSSAFLYSASSGQCLRRAVRKGDRPAGSRHKIASADGKYLGRLSQCFVEERDFDAEEGIVSVILLYTVV